MSNINKLNVCNWRIFKRKKHVLNGCMAASSALVIAVVATSAMAAPTGGNIVAGSGSIKQSGLNTNINQNSSTLDIKWDTFSSNVNESINFSQPGKDAIAINRVVGGVPSQLKGALNANGNVYILNDAGITFFDTSRVNVGALLATTARDVSFDGNKISFSNSGDASIINNGNITVSNGGWAVLAAPNVENNGVVVADLGRIELASATEFTLDLRGDNLITYSLSEESLNKIGVSNNGVLQARSGTIAISANVASEIVSSVVNLDGVVDADAFADAGNGGRVLVSSVGDINNRASITADAKTNGNGGTVLSVAEKDMNFSKGATISTKGGLAAGNGGFVEVSGDRVNLKGKVTTLAANGKMGTLYIDPAHIVIKDKSDHPIFEEEPIEPIDGGEAVIVPVDSNNENNIENGNGDRITRNPISGSQSTNEDDGGVESVIADNIVITPVDAENVSNNEPDEPIEVTERTSYFYEDDLENQESNVILEAEKSITLEDLQDNNLEVALGGADKSITLRTTASDNGLITFEDKDDAITTSLGDITLQTNGGQGIDIGSLRTGGDVLQAGSIYLVANGEGSVRAENLSATSHYNNDPTRADGPSNLQSDVTIDIDSANDITINGTLETDSVISAQDVREFNIAANISLNAGQAIVLNGAVNGNAQGNLNINAVDIPERGGFSNNTNSHVTSVVSLNAHSLEVNSDINNNAHAQYFSADDAEYASINAYALTDATVQDEIDVDGNISSHSVVDAYNTTPSRGQTISDNEIGIYSLAGSITMKGNVHASSYAGGINVENKAGSDVVIQAPGNVNIDSNLYNEARAIRYDKNLLPDDIRAQAYTEVSAGNKLTVKYDEIPTVIANEEILEQDFSGTAGDSEEDFAQLVLNGASITVEGPEGPTPPPVIDPEEPVDPVEPVTPDEPVAPVEPENPDGGDDNGIDPKINVINSLRDSADNNPGEPVGGENLGQIAPAAGGEAGQTATDKFCESVNVDKYPAICAKQNTNFE